MGRQFRTAKRIFIAGAHDESIERRSVDAECTSGALGLSACRTDADSDGLIIRGPRRLISTCRPIAAIVFGWKAFAPRIVHRKLDGRQSPERYRRARANLFGEVPLQPIAHEGVRCENRDAISGDVDPSLRRKPQLISRAADPRDQLCLDRSR
jgi:hypothetical protein